MNRLHFFITHFFIVLFCSTWTFGKEKNLNSNLNKERPNKKISLSQNLSKNFSSETKISKKQLFSRPKKSKSSKRTINPDDPMPIWPPPNKIPKSLLGMGKGKYFSAYAFLMDKFNRTLSLWKRTKNKIKFVRAYPADIGKKLGNKDMLGDLKTPEGIYFFQEIYEGPELDYENYGVRAFTMDYPNFFDLLAKKTGHGIWLHSIPDERSLYRSSRGCIVVRNHVIKSISPYIQKKFTPIIVQKKVQYISQNEHKLLKKEAFDWLKSWKTSWESKNLKQYLSYYEKNFKSQGKNKQAWREYKQRLNKHYNYIHVSIKKPVFYFEGNKMIVRFLQFYQSDQISDFGEKFLYLVKRKKSLKASSIPYGIVGEVWSPLPSTMIAELSEDFSSQKTRPRSSKSFLKNSNENLKF